MISKNAHISKIMYHDFKAFFSFIKFINKTKINFLT